jgi:hypothetical protein
MLGAMSGTSSTRWYFTDWMSDPNVRACSLAARGLWIDLLCVAGMNSGRDHGFVLVGGRVQTAANIARLVGSSEPEVSGLLDELATNKVFNRDRRGAIYCRRMVKAEKNRGNGRLAVSDKTLKNLRNKKPLDNIVEPLLPKPLPVPDSERKKANKRTRSAAAPLPTGWKPTVADLGYATKRGFNGGRLDDLLASFADHHRSRGNEMADWDAAWRNWVRNEIKFSTRRFGTTNGTPRPGSKEDQRERSSRAYQQLCDCVDADADERRRREGFGEASFGFLPPPERARS